MPLNSGSVDRIIPLIYNCVLVIHYTNTRNIYTVQAVGTAVQGKERTMFKLCMAEKPSVAKDIAAVIGADKRCNGYFEGNGYRVTWAVGHLVGLAEPDAYGFVPQDEMYGDQTQAAYDELPLIPDEFKLIVLEPTKDQFEIVKKLIHDPECEEIINCGDMGAEGHILQWFIREKAGCTKKVRRFCATSMTEEAIRDAMEHLRPEEEFANIIKGEFCKKKADWIMGMSMSRAESIKYHTGINVGRVQSPTLYFVVKRYLDAQNFKVTNYYGMEAEFDEGFCVAWSKDMEGIFPLDAKDSENRVLDKVLVEAKCRSIEQGRTGTVFEVETKKKGTDRPQLYDITELQRDANRKYGYTAAVTLATAQALYETQKVLSYPRTDSRYITSDLKPYMPSRIKAIGTVGEKYQAAADDLLARGLNIDKKIVDDSKVTDHHALIPTEKIEGFNINEMKPTDKERKDGVTEETMRNILELVLCRMIVSFSQMYVYEQTSISVRLADATFTASGKKPVEYGWTAVQEKLGGRNADEDGEGDSAGQIFPELKKGQTVTVKSCKTVPKKTTPPKLHTEATLLTAMENAGATIEGGSILKGKGIGTQATRAEIIKKLFDTGYCETQTKGKTNYIIPTAKGLSIIRVLPPELYSPKITADWETKIAKIADGSMTEQEFMDEFCAFIRAKVQEVKTTDTGITFKKERQVYGKCPFCGGDVYRYQAAGEKKVRFYCGDKGCPFSVDTENPTVTTWTGKKLTEKQCIQLIAKKFLVLDCKRKSGEGTYKGKFVFTKREVGGKTFTNLQCEPVKPSRMKKK